MPSGAVASSCCHAREDGIHEVGEGRDIGADQLPVRGSSFEALQHEMSSVSAPLGEQGLTHHQASVWCVLGGEGGGGACENGCDRLRARGVQTDLVPVTHPDAYPTSASYSDFTAIDVTVEAGVAWVTLDHPPLNVLDVDLGSDLHDFAVRVAPDTTVRVVVFQSANPDYVAAHADIGWMFDPSTLMELADPDASEGLNPLQQLNERLRNLPQVTIAKLRGFARAGGAELAMTVDMRFAAAGQTWLGQPETLMGIFPGGGGTQYLTRLLGRARALSRSSWAPNCSTPTWPSATAG